MVALVKGFFYSRFNLVGSLHLSHTITTATSIGFNETRQPQSFYNSRGIDLLSLFNQNRVGYVHAKSLQEVVAGKLVESDAGSQHIATSIRDIQQFEIPLQFAVLARHAVNGNIGTGELDFLTLGICKAEVVFVDIEFLVTILHFPVLSNDGNNVKVVLFFVDKRVDTGSTAERNLLFALVAASNNCNILFHFMRFFCLTQI